MMRRQNHMQCAVGIFHRGPFGLQTLYSFQSRIGLVRRCLH